MKNINFQRGTSMIRTWEQDQKSRVPFNWDRFIYIIILIIVLYFFFQFLLHKLFWIEADGQVIFEKVNIMNVDDSRILKFHVEEGEEVKIGDTLFTYFEDDDAFGNYSGNGGRGGSSASLTEGSNNDWIEREIYTLSRQIAGNEIRLKESIALLELQESKLEQTRNEVILELIPRNRLDLLEESISSLRFDIDKINSDLIMSKQFLGRLYAMRKPNIPAQINVSNNGTGNGGGGDDQGKKVFYSPLAGTVTKINFKPFEVALKSEVILSIHQPENIFIKGFFDQADLDKLQEGDEVSLEFPNGRKSRGFIKRFYFATNTLPEEFQKKYEPTTRSLVADIYPIDSIELDRWKAFYKMSVLITKYRY